MGNLLTPLLGEIFRSYIENKLHSNPITKNFVYWYRYVEDILVCCIVTQRKLDTLIHFINSLDSITMEIEQSNSINFLDITISKQLSKHECSIFHIPSLINITIHNSSLHPYQSKLSAFNNMIHRSVTIY